MGYKPSRTLYKLDFSETEFAGLEVTTRSVQLDVLLEMADMADQVEDLAAKKQPGLKDLKVVVTLLTEFSKILVGWNVENDDDTPVPATYEGLKSQELTFIMAVISAWTTAMAKAPPPLPGASPSGATSQEKSLAAESVSRPPQN